MTQPIDLGLVLHYMRAVMRDRAREVQAGRSTVEIQYGGIIELTIQKMEQAQLIELPRRNYGTLDTMVGPELSRLVVEAFHYLLHNGLITRRPDPPNFPGHSNTNRWD